MAQKLGVAKKSKSPSLNVTLAGVEFRSPFGLAAIGSLFGRQNKVTPKLHAEILLRGTEAGAGYIYVGGGAGSYTKETMAKLKEKVKPRPGKFPVHRTMDMRVAGMEGDYRVVTPFVMGTDVNLERMRERSRDAEELIKILKDKMPEGVRLIASPGGYTDVPETYAEAAKNCEQLGADLLQLNFSCPFPATLSGAVEDFFEGRRARGVLIGDNPDLVEKITRVVAKAVKIPVGVKLSPETGFPRVVGIARRARDAGAKWIESVNEGIVIAPPDIYRGGKPLWAFIDAHSFGAIHGSWLRPICFKHVAAIARFVPGLDIAASGGLMKPEHCIEVMMLGARLAQLCTGVIEKGNNFIRQCNAFLSKFMVEQGYQSVEEFIGIAQQYIKYNEELRVTEAVAELDESKCTVCGICADGLCIALSLNSGSIELDTDKCAGCGMCTIACTAGALKLVART